jgi:hypothetical protein
MILSEQVLEKDKHQIQRNFQEGKKESRDG